MSAECVAENIPPGYKQTEVGVIPEDWDETPLGVIFSFKNGLNKGKEYFGYGTPIVNYMDVYNHPGLLLSNLRGLVDVTRQELDAFGVWQGDVFFTRTSETVEEVGIASVLLDESPDTVFSGFVLRARPKGNSLSNNFKKYCFSSSIVRHQIISKSTYTTRALTNGRVLSAVILPVPPILAEQEAIAEALSDADAFIESLEQLIAKKRLIKQCAMQELLTGKRRLSGFEIKRGYKQTEVGLIPEDWEVSSLRNCCCKITDGTHDTPKPVRSGFPFLTAIHVKDNWIDYDSCLFVTEADHKIIFNRCNPEKNDVLMVNIGMGIATTALVNVDYEFSLKNVALLKPESRRTVGSYLNYSLAQMKQKITKDLSSGGAQPFLSLTQIGEIAISLPLTLAEQKAITSIISDMDSEITTLEEKLAKTRQIKQGMMQELLTGRIRLL